MILLSAPILAQLGITPGQEIFLSAGSKKTLTTIERGMAINDFKVSIDPYTMSKISLRGYNQPLAYYKKRENELKLGPVIAVLKGMPVMLLEPRIISLYKTIAESAKEAGMLFYLFTPDFINFEKETVSGFQYRSNSRTGNDWVMQEFPLPDVVYNQVGFISDELKPVYRYFLLDYLKMGNNIKLINPAMALNDKLFTHKILSKAPQLKNYLPETERCAGVADVISFFEKYGAVYLKPTVSSLGRGIYKVIMQRHNCFVKQSHQGDGEKITETAGNMDELSEMLQKLTGARQYLVQQPIDLLRYENRPVDFRVHLFKNLQGCWDRLTVRARTGPVDGVITGSGWGGSSLQGEKLLYILFPPDDASYMIEKIDKITLKLAKALEQLHEAEFGELGFDLGVSRDKKVWMIEVNPKPNWNVPPGVDVAAAEKNLADHFLGYCRYLLGLNQSDVNFGMF